MWRVRDVHSSRHEHHTQPHPLLPTSLQPPDNRYRHPQDHHITHQRQRRRRLEELQRIHTFGFNCVIPKTPDGHAFEHEAEEAGDEAGEDEGADGVDGATEAGGGEDAIVEEEDAKFDESRGDYPGDEEGIEAL